MGENLLSFEHVSKSYYGNTVLKDISMDLTKGEIHALIGENGAGKSTLMNILFGMSVIHETGGFEGVVKINGQEVKVQSPHQAMQHGIGMVHQEFMLIPGFTVTENIKLNRERTKKSLAGMLFGKRLDTLDWKRMEKESRQALDILDMDIETYTRVAGLPVGHMQFIEIAREIDKEGIQILVFDEPTAVLAEAEAENLLKAVRTLADQGIGIIFISHRLNEIMDVADRVTILRDGEHVITKAIKDTSAVEIAKYMVGREITIDRVDTEKKVISDDIILSIKNMFVNMPGEQVAGTSLEVRQGEILGIGGLAGQGKLGIANGLMGTYPAKGEILFEQKPLKLNNPRGAIESGFAFVSEDRKGVGLLLDESIELNIVFTSMQIHNKFLTSNPFMKIKNSREIRSHAKEMIKKLDIRCISPLQKTGSLSGGNQQKVCIARALTQDPKLLFVSEPTRGIDIGAKKLVLDLLLKLNQDFGLTIVITSSELAELRSICDQVAIVCEGKVLGILPPDAPDEDFGLLMSGIRLQEKGGETA